MADRYNNIGDAPIEGKLRDKMNAMAQALDGMLNGEAKGRARTTGFVLMIFPFDATEGRCNYISNADRDSVVTLLRDQLARFERAGG